MLWVKLPVVKRIQPRSNKFAMGAENEATGISKLNDSLAITVTTTPLLLYGFSCETPSSFCGIAATSAISGSSCFACFFLFLFFFAF